MDPLSDVLALARVESSVFSRADLRGRWAVSTKGAPWAIFHVVLEGGGAIEVEDGSTTPLAQGDFVVMPHGHGHVLSSAPVLPRPIRDLPSEPGPDGLPCVTAGDGGARTHLACGTFRFGGPGRDLLLPALPPMLHVAGGGVMGAWITASLALLASELGEGRPGAVHLAARVGEVLLVQALRAHAPAAGGWLAATADVRLAPALAVLHSHPERDWTVERLARKSALSRTAFYERWTAIVGESPGAYLTRLRMVRARDGLRSEASVAEVAAAVGYGSEAAFSRAFKRHVGASPSAWRTAQG